jgi:hypothetical protein
MSGWRSWLLSVVAPPAPSPIEPADSPTPPVRGLLPADFVAAADTLSCDVAAIRAFADVESSGSGFLADGRPVILFEAHRFHALTKGRFWNAVDRHGVALSVKEWDRSLYGASGAHQWERHDDAAELDQAAADGACSWGEFQIMGSNYKLAGHKTQASFVAAMKLSSRAHLDAFVAFVSASGLRSALRAHDWRTCARVYNGSGQVDAYAARLELAHRQWGGK